MIIFLILLMVGLSLYLGYGMGYKKGFFRGAYMGAQLESKLYQDSITKLKVQDQYATLIEDVTAQYNHEVESFYKELKRR